MEPDLASSFNHVVSGSRCHFMTWDRKATEALVWFHALVLGERVANAGYPPDLHSAGVTKAQYNNYPMVEPLPPQVYLAVGLAPRLGSAGPGEVIHYPGGHAHTQIAPAGPSERVAVARLSFPALLDQVFGGPHSVTGTSTFQVPAGTPKGDLDASPDVGAVLQTITSSKLFGDQCDWTNPTVQDTVDVLSTIQTDYWCGGDQTPWNVKFHPDGTCTTPGSKRFRMTEQQYNAWRLSCENLLKRHAAAERAAVMQWVADLNHELLEIPPEHGIVGNCFFEASAPEFVSETKNSSEWLQAARSARQQCVDLLRKLGGGYTNPQYDPETAPAATVWDHIQSDHTSGGFASFEAYLLHMERPEVYVGDLMLHVYAEIFGPLHVYIAPSNVFHMNKTTEVRVSGWPDDHSPRTKRADIQLPDRRDHDTVLYLCGNHYARLLAQARTRTMDDPA